MDRIADRSASPRPSKTYRATTPEARTSWLGRDRAIGRALLAVVVLGVVWRVARYAACPPIWGDEAFLAVNLLVRDFAGLLQPLEYYQIAPAGFLWAERTVVRALGPSEWSIRLIPFLSGLATFGLFLRFAGRTLDRRSALMAVGIFAASFYPVRHATEAKPYATDLLLSMMTTGLAWSIYRDRNSARSWLAMTGLVAVGVWFSYPLVFVAAGVGSVLGFEAWKGKDRRALAWSFGFGLVTSASWLASYLLVAAPQAKAAPFYSALETWQGSFPPWNRPWILPAWLVDVHTGNMLAYPNGGNNFGSLATAVLVVAGCLALRKSRPGLLAILLSPLAFTLLASSLRRYPYGTSARTTLFMAPAFCLLAGSGLVSLARRLRGASRVRIYRLSFLTLAAMMLVATVVNVAWPYKNYEDGENRRAVVDLANLARPGDRWIVYDGVATLPISPKLMLEHWLQQMAEVRYDVLAKAPVPVEWLPEPVGTGRGGMVLSSSPLPLGEGPGVRGDASTEAPRDRARMGSATTLTPGPSPRGSGEEEGPQADQKVTGRRAKGIGDIPGRTWLIVHRSGCRSFDERGLDRLKGDLARELGPPRARVDRLTRGESIESFEYSAPAPEGLGR